MASQSDHDLIFPSLSDLQFPIQSGRTDQEGIVDMPYNQTYYAIIDMGRYLSTFERAPMESHLIEV